jgi:FMN phosphatase YigB (HAD superfamily)
VQFDAIIFDFGNTLIPWGPQQGLALYHAVRDVLDPIEDFDARARQAHMGLVRERENGSMAEVTCAEFVSAILGEPAPEELVKRAEAAAGAAFVELAVVPEHVRPLLDKLRARYRLAVLSNFFLEGPVEEVLRRSGLAEYFDHVEVSASGGWMKPHPEPFDKVRAALGTQMERTLMVGDDFFADIVGGYRAGLLTALSHEYHQAEPSDARAPEVTPDRILTSLHELDS